MVPASRVRPAGVVDGYRITLRRGTGSTWVDDNTGRRQVVAGVVCRLLCGRCGAGYGKAAGNNAGGLRGGLCVVIGGGAL